MLGVNMGGPQANTAVSAERLPNTANYHQKPNAVTRPDELREFSVVYTDRALNHMSATFQGIMKELNEVLCDAYSAKCAVLIPGSGTFAMEAVARQLIPALKGGEDKVLVLRNGYFSYRWTDILTQTGLAAEHVVIKAIAVDPTQNSPAFHPLPIEDVVAQIKEHKPKVVFAPHVETSTGILLPDSYIKQVSMAVHANGGYFVLDGIAAGFKWARMDDLGCDFYISAPQKAWSAPAGVGVVMVSERGYKRIQETSSDSMAINLKKWLGVMESYLKSPGTEHENGPGHSYHTTMPTDVIHLFKNAAVETRDAYSGRWDEAEAAFSEQGRKVYELLEEKFGLKIVAADGYRAPGVVVAYAPAATDLNMVVAFKKLGMQVAAGVPFKLDEDPTKVGTTFRLGLFGLDKIYEGQATIDRLGKALSEILAAGARGKL